MTTKLKPEHLILFVEDNDEDYETAMRAFKKSSLANPVHRCIDGDTAIDYLKKSSLDNKDGTLKRPEMILLDINLPGTDGKAVLKFVKSNPLLKTIPVIMLTTSDDERDIQSCYAMGANSYILKPVNLEGFFGAIQRLKEFWFEVAILPKN